MMAIVGVPIRLRLDGAVWLNLDVCLRNLTQILSAQIAPVGISEIEFYMLLSLFERDAQQASELARSVGRAATSFTPNIDQLERKGLICRKDDPNDRRSVRIYLTDSGNKKKKEIQDIHASIQKRLREAIGEENFDSFCQAMATLQKII